MLHRLTVLKEKTRHINQLHREWDNCTRCPLHERRTTVVHARGRLPCTVLLIGEAPGKDEDRTGFPFVGRAGKLLEEKILPEIYSLLGQKFTYAIINAVGCAPYREVITPGEFTPHLKIGPPERMELQACRSHMESLIAMASPRACLLLGDVARKAVGSTVMGRLLQPVPTCHVYHPAYLLRQGGDRSLAFQKLVDTSVRYLRKQLGIPSIGPPY